MEEYAFPAPPAPQHDLLSFSFDQGDPLPLTFDLEQTNFMAPADESTIANETTMANDTEKEVLVPEHPIASMQRAFAESMQEAAKSSTPDDPSDRLPTAAARRQLLIDQDISEETHASRWKQQPGQQYHQLWKLMAQISFGIYLLLNGIAKDENQVMTILQGHVDEVDEFLETTLDDFDLAQEDIEERLKFLKLPLENITIFDAMLEDRAFRLQIVTGNERIEHVIQRTAKAMNDALKDVQHGLDACKEFTIYLAKEVDTAIWRDERPDMEKVFEAMKGNVEGWFKAYVSLQTKGNHLGVVLVQLGSIVAEMDRRAGEVSRKTRFSTSTKSSISNSPGSPPPTSPPRVSRQMRQSMLKKLPTDPNMITPAIQATIPAFQMVQDRERTPEPETIESDTQSGETTPEPILEEFLLSPTIYTPVPSPLLSPTVYTPVPSPKTRPEPRREPNPEPRQAPTEPAVVSEVRKRSSLRKRFSLKRNENPKEIILQPPPRPKHRATENHNLAPRQRTYSTSAAQSDSRRSHDIPPSIPRERSANTPPSRGLDSAYCSDFEKGFSPQIQQHTSQLSQSTSNTVRQPPGRTDSPPVLSGSSLPSPHFPQQFFHPVNASPHSPLQRPWTAAPTPNHIHNNSHSSNDSRAPSAHGSHHGSQYGTRRPIPSAMGLSMMSDMTTMTENGKKVKKKRSAFGWLKKAFALSEEEKLAFEERKRRTDWDSRAYYEQPRQKWVDGRRVR